MLFYLILKFSNSVDQPAVCVSGGGGGGERSGFVVSQFRLALFIFFHYEDARYQLNHKNAIFGSLR